MSTQEKSSKSSKKNQQEPRNTQRHPKEKKNTYITAAFKSNRTQEKLLAFKASVAEAQRADPNLTLSQKSSTRSPKYFKHSSISFHPEHQNYSQYTAAPKHFCLLPFTKTTMFWQNKAEIPAGDSQDTPASLHNFCQRVEATSHCKTHDS